MYMYKIYTVKKSFNFFSFELLMSITGEKKKDGRERKWERDALSIKRLRL